jgi:uncharacterized SAM-binding protein YcdF (DUF218 family)
MTQTALRFCHFGFTQVTNVSGLSSHKLSTWQIIAISVGSGVAALLILGAGIYMMRQARLNVLMKQTGEN